MLFKAGSCRPHLLKFRVTPTRDALQGRLPEVLVNKRFSGTNLTPFHISIIIGPIFHTVIDFLGLIKLEPHVPRPRLVSNNCPGWSGQTGHRCPTQPFPKRGTPKRSGSETCRPLAQSITALVRPHDGVELIEKSPTPKLGRCYSGMIASADKQMRWFGLLNRGTVFRGGPAPRRRVYSAGYREAMVIGHKESCPPKRR